MENISKYTKLILKKQGLNQDEISNYFRRRDNLREAIHPGSADKIINHSEFLIKSSDGIPIFAQKWIPNNPQGLFLCQHGNSVHGDLFVPFADGAYTKGWAVISLDNRGHGRSGPTRGRLDDPKKMISVYHAIISIWRKKFPNAPICFIGESLGCTMVSMYLNSKMGLSAPPDRVVFMVPPYIVRGTEHIMQIRTIIKPITYFLLTILSKITFQRPLMQHRFYEPVKTYIKEFQNYDEKDPLVNDWIYLGNYRSLIELLIGFKNKAKTINLPILILQGTGDDILNPKGARELYSKIRSENKILVYYKNANHSLFMDKFSQNIYKDILKWVEPKKIE